MITLTTPVTQPAATYSGYWLNSIVIAAPSPTAPASARIAMTPYDASTGQQQMGAVKFFTIADLFGRASSDPTTGAAVTAAIAALISAVNAVAAQKSLL